MTDPVGILVVDKPVGMTSHGVVARIRRALGTRKVGHAGTLDPDATGVLVLGIGPATRLLGYLAASDKEYLSTIILGQSTVTDDAAGETVDWTDARELRRDAVERAMGSLTGDILQRPSSVSAIKVSGKRAYDLVRAGQDVELAARPVRVHAFDLLGIREEERDGHAVAVLDVRVDCSAGTYVRALARDLGAALGVGGHLTALRRTAVGPFTLEHARTLDEVREDGRVSLDIDEAVKLSFPRRDISDDEAESISQGRWLEPIGMKGVYVVVDPHEQAIALIQEKGKRASSVMVVRPATLR